jgi:hypothetical protein
VVARLAVELTERCAELTITIKALEKEITELTTQLAPALLELPGCGALTAAKIIGETAGVDRFKSRDAFDRGARDRPRHRTERETHSSISALLWLPARGFSAGSGWAVLSGGLPRRRRGGGRAREGIDDHRRQRPIRARIFNSGNTSRFSGTADPNACRNRGTGIRASAVQRRVQVSCAHGNR